MTYANIDPIITAWINKHDLRLFTKFADYEARFVYVSSNRGECFQIAVGEPKDGKVSISACDVESHNNEELEANLVIEQSKLADALEDIIATVYIWIKRHDPSAVRFVPD